jgi:hypothetical protein
MDVAARIETRIESGVVEIVDRSGGVPVAAHAVMDRRRAGGGPLVGRDVDVLDVGHGKTLLLQW